MSPRHLIAVVLVAALAGGLCAQTLVYSGAVAFSGSSSHKHVVRDAQGTLWSLAVGDNAAGDRPLFLHSSTNGGASWILDPLTLNDATSGLSGSNLTNACSLAIDDQGTLHAIWAGFYYPSYFKQYYRNYNPATGIASSVVDLSATIGSTISNRTTALDIAVAQDGIVWIVGHASSSWVDRLVRTDLAYDPLLPTPTFTVIGNVSPGSSAQSVSIAVDVQGMIHCSYYRNVAPGNYEHRAYDPAAGSWGPATTLGNTTPTNDFYGKLCADLLGNVHSLYGMDLGPSDTWKYRYKKWDAVNGWGPEEVLFDFAPTLHSGVANRYIVALGCDETSSKAWVVYRDLANGAGMRVLERDPNTATWVNLPDLAPPATGAHEYYRPNVRGTLFPAFNNTASDLDVTYRQGVSPGPYSLIFHRVSFGGPQASLTLGSAPTIGTLVPVQISSPVDSLKIFVCGFAVGNSPGVVLPDLRVIPINLDALFQFSVMPGNGIFVGNVGTLDINGDATAQILIPNAPQIVGASIYGAFVVPDSGSPYGVGTISPGLTVTFQ